MNEDNKYLKNDVESGDNRLREVGDNIMEILVKGFGNEFYGDEYVVYDLNG